MSDADDDESYLTPREAKELLKEARKRDKNRATLQKRRQKGTSVPNTVQRQIRYEAMFEDGICQITPEEFSITVGFSDINYQNINITDQMTVFERYCEALNYFDSTTSIQLSIYNRKATEDEMQDIFFKKPAEDDGLDECREEFNGMLRAHVSSGKSDRVLDHFLTITVNEKSLEKAKEILVRNARDLMASFDLMGSRTWILNGYERLELLNNVFWPQEPFVFDYRSLLTSSLRTKDAIAPMMINIPKKPSNVLAYGDTYGRCLALTAQGYPSDLSDRLISEIAYLDVNMVITFHLKPMPQDKAIDIINAKLVSMNAERYLARNKAIKKGFDPDEMVPYELRDRIEDAEELRTDIKSRNQRMFRGAFLVYLYADSMEKLDHATRHVKSSAYKMMYRLSSIELAPNLIDALNSCLPIGKSYTGSIERTLTTVNAGVIMPFSTMQLQQPGGLYYGKQELNDSFIQVDRLSLKAAHGMYLGSTGSGKSFAVKREIVQVLMRKKNAQVLIEDPDNEYTDYVRALGGTYIDIRPDSKDFINMMDIAKDGQGSYQLADKSQFLMGVCEEVYPADPKELSLLRSIVDRCTLEVYEPFLSSRDVTTLPTIIEFLTVLDRQPEALAKELSLALESYAVGTMAQFSRRSTIDMDNRLIGIGMKNAGRIYKATAQHIIADMLWNKLMENYARGIETWLYFDEFQTQLKSPSQSEYFLNIWSRGRKFNGVCNAITQAPDTILSHTEARKALENSPFVALFNISDPGEICEFFKFSNKQRDYITNPKPGSGVYRIEDVLIAFKDDFPKNTKLYRLMTTKPSETML